MRTSLQLVVDVICPWCFIGKRRLDGALAAVPAGAPPAIAWRPYELDRGMPPEGADRASYRARRFGSLERSRAMDARAEPAGQHVDIEFRYDLMTRTPNTFMARRYCATRRRKA